MRPRYRALTLRSVAQVARSHVLLVAPLWLHSEAPVGRSSRLLCVRSLRDTLEEPCSRPLLTRAQPGHVVSRNVDSRNFALNGPLAPHRVSVWALARGCGRLSRCLGGATGHWAHSTLLGSTIAVLSGIGPKTIKACSASFLLKKVLFFG